jgi:predicted metallopeptidase
MNDGISNNNKLNAIKSRTASGALRAHTQKYQGRQTYHMHNGKQYGMFKEV